jgi:hypothetical protein
MLTRFRWCSSVALCLDAQLIVSKPDTMLHSLLSCTFGGKRAKTATPIALGQLNAGA